MLHRELYPDLLVSAQLGRRVCACANKQVTDLDEAVEAVAEEGSDAQGTRELVRHAGGLSADDDVLGAQHEKRLRARTESVRERADDGYRRER